jgi:YesN/AraC family two-component response regulator
MKTILICEDEQDTQESLKNILVRNEYEVYSAFDGKEAIDKVKEVKPDLVVLDIRMPKINGLEVAGEIRKFDKVTRIIFITAFQSPELSKEAAKYDIVDYIVKPAAAEDILKVIKQSLS